MATSYHHFLILPVVLLTLIPIITAEVYQNGSDISLKPELSTEFGSDGNDEKSRTKRHHLNNISGSGSGSIEGLLASCQLTNLLLYQLLRQGTSQGQSSSIPGTGIGGIQPFPAAAGLVNNFLFPPRLTTYVTTSTFTTKMTTSTVITIPLLFGNKPSPTTITRTTTFDLTTSQVQTITTTIQESSSTTVVTPTASMVLAPTTPLSYIPPPSVQEPEPEYNNDVIDFQNRAPLDTPENSDEEVVSPLPPRVSFRDRKRNGQVRDITPSQPSTKVVITRKVLRSNPATTQNYIEEDDSEGTPAYRYGPAAYGRNNWEQEQTPRQQNYYRAPEVQPRQEYHDEGESSRKYYARRLKRRGDAEEKEPGEDNLDRGYLLEPSFRSEVISSVGFREPVACTPPLTIETTITVTKTITKFVNPPVGVASREVSVAAREVVRPTSGYGDQWRSADQGQRRGGRRFEGTRTQDDQSSSPPLPVYQEQASEPSTRPQQSGRRRTKTQSSQAPSSDEVTPLYLTPSFQEASSTRTRGRGDILYRARSSPLPSPSPPIAPETPRSENYSEEIRDSGRVRQRQRTRRPVE